jgi:putative PIN family toxin of toxin-antitoxin system
VIPAVLDTNVLASGFLNPEPTPGQLLAAWREGLYTLVISEHILTELARTFRRPYFSRRLSPAQQAANITLLRQQATLTELTVSVTGIATHPEDDLILATALSGRAEYLVSGDAPLRQRLGASYQAVRIVTPQEFLDILRKEVG